MAASLRLNTRTTRELRNETLRDRITYHFEGNAEESGLRLSVGVLLGEPPRVELRRVGSAKRMTFRKGEEPLSHRMDTNAPVGWVLHARPWEFEV